MPFVTRLSAMCVAGAALTASANASATHYYATHTAQVDGYRAAADDGASTAIWTSILNSTCNIFQHDFVNHEFWYASDNGAYW
ncbi:MAG: hypothetical protein M3O46_09550, partial [Myxococcota bacterium]|nr:hypothetical protein [Myxococcota bacterium]